MKPAHAQWACRLRQECTLKVGGVACAESIYAHDSLSISSRSCLLIARLCDDRGNKKQQRFHHAGRHVATMRNQVYYFIISKFWIVAIYLLVFTYTVRLVWHWHNLFKTCVLDVLWFLFRHFRHSIRLLFVIFDRWLPLLCVGVLCRATWLQQKKTIARAVDNSHGTLAHKHAMRPLPKQQQEYCHWGLSWRFRRWWLRMMSILEIEPESEQ